MNTNKKRRLVTSALPYVNNVPHLGNLIQVLSADVFARYCRSAGYETLYVCGTDEYGTATETRAAAEGVTPAELCGRYHEIHKQIYRWFNINFDKFGRTSTPIQTEIVQDIFKKLDAAGFITEHTIEQLYCEQCGRFLADRFVAGTCPNCGNEDARGDQCEACGKLLDPTDLKNPRCSTCGSTPMLKETKHLYIDLPKIKSLLEPWIEETSVSGFWAANAVQMTRAWIRDGLHERAITRDLKWGIPVPKAGFENKVFYVWFDAPIGYISITGCLGEEVASSKEQGASEKSATCYLLPATSIKSWQDFVDYWWHDPDNVELFQFIGKDNIPFHTVIFPSSLLGSEKGGAKPWTKLYHMSSTEYLNYEAGKFSKSKGIGVFGTDVMETGIPADVWRFYIFYNRPEKSDALFTWKDFAEKVNGELIGNMGNLVNRTLTFVQKYYEGNVPAQVIPPGVKPVSHTEDWMASYFVPGSRAERLGYDNAHLDYKVFWDTVIEFEATITAQMERADERDAFHSIFELCDFCNKTFQAGEPWKARTTDPIAAEALISNLCYVVKDLAILVEPFMPETAATIAGFFGLKDLSWADLGKTDGLEKVVSTKVLFNKLEDTMIDELREKYSGSQQERESHAEPQRRGESNEKSNQASASPRDEISSYEFFAKNVALRTAKILSAEKHPNADKLFVINLDIAGENRTICSGLVGIYTAEELVGKSIIVAWNLKGRKMRGIESHGMLLAASKNVADAEGDVHEIVDVLDSASVPGGTWVAVDGCPVDPADYPEEIDIDTFCKVPMTVKDYAVSVDSKALMLNGAQIKALKVDNGEVH
ncbi:MAG: methionine--tRNA ligase [Spirochaetaceae bacterium]|jgi:methionyl-tRNA synthetase|nr:methionine--tRNA ligase [Spirochaetaceae bacterium]